MANRTSFYEFLLAGDDGGTCFINVNQVAAFQPAFDRGGIWTGCTVLMASGGSIMINHSLEQIEDILKSAPTIGGAS